MSGITQYLDWRKKRWIDNKNWAHIKLRWVFTVSYYSKLEAESKAMIQIIGVINIVLIQQIQRFQTQNLFSGETAISLQNCSYWETKFWAGNGWKRERF